MTPNCLACGRDDRETPLVPILHQGTQLHICPQHLPVLIHHPMELEDKLQGAGRLAPADPRD